MYRSRARLVLAGLLMVTTIDSAAAVCAYVCANRSERTLRPSAPASHSCHEVAVAPGGNGALTAVPERCAPERPALITARLDAPAFNRAIARDQIVDLVHAANPQSSIHLFQSPRSAPPGAPPGAPLPLRI
jgi:hypothetical protein